jgi:fumarate hydratase class I
MPWQPLLTDLIRRTSTELPPDVVAALRGGAAVEAPGSRADFTLRTILENVDLARQRVVPMCQDTGTLTFWIDMPCGTDTVPLEAAVRAAVAEATRNGWLRQNTISEPDGRSRADNLSDSHPVVHFRAADRPDVRVRLLMKGGGCENMSRQYSLPDSALDAGRDLDGVRRCILDAVWQAQGNGCAPGILGVCVGGDRATGYEVAKEQLLRPVGDRSPEPSLAALERRVLEEAQTLGIGPMGMAGRTTLLGVLIAAASRLPASYFVTVATLCWACRRGVLHATVDGTQVL